jgi:hypothetical protein
MRNNKKLVFIKENLEKYSIFLIERDLEKKERLGEKGLCGMMPC